MKIDNETKIISSIAIKSSKLGAAMHNSAFDNLNFNFIYIPLAISNCKNTIFGIRALNFHGITVSMPYKQEVMKYIDKIDPIAKKIGAVNTILNYNGKLIGYNSDWIGVILALKEVSDIENKNVVLLGAGGVARAIAYGLKENNCNVTIFNRTSKKAKKLSKEFNLNYGGTIEDFKNIDDYDILINATSVGFFPNNENSILSENQIKENKIVMDVVFMPTETVFMKFAKNKNCKVVPGYRMLIHQAIFQFELFTKQKAPFEVMEKVLLENLK